MTRNKVIFKRAKDLPWSEVERELLHWLVVSPWGVFVDLSHKRRILIVFDSSRELSMFCQSVADHAQYTGHAADSLPGRILRAESDELPDDDGHLDWEYDLHLEKVQQAHEDGELPEPEYVAYASVSFGAADLKAVVTALREQAWTDVTTDASLLVSSDF